MTKFMNIIANTLLVAVLVVGFWNLAHHYEMFPAAWETHSTGTEPALLLVIGYLLASLVHQRLEYEGWLADMSESWKKAIDRSIKGDSNGRKIISFIKEHHPDTYSALCSAFPDVELEYTSNV